MTRTAAALLSVTLLQAACGDNVEPPPGGREMVEELAHAQCAWPKHRCDYPEPMRTEKIRQCTEAVVRAMCSRRWDCSEGALYPAHLLDQAAQCLDELTGVCAPPWTELPTVCVALFQW
jgi:hypothetical protein